MDPSPQWVCRAGLESPEDFLGCCSVVPLTFTDLSRRPPRFLHWYPGILGGHAAKLLRAHLKKRLGGRASFVVPADADPGAFQGAGCTSSPNTPTAEKTLFPLGRDSAATSVMMRPSPGHVGAARGSEDACGLEAPGARRRRGVEDWGRVCAAPRPPPPQGLLRRRRLTDAEGGGASRSPTPRRNGTVGHSTRV